MSEMGTTYSIVVAETEGKRLFRRPKHRLEINIKLDLKNTKCESVGSRWGQNAGSCEHRNGTWGSV
jgi:hypothetical protein